jgi:regulator of nucleoside diphosphate kinase
MHGTNNIVITHDDRRRLGTLIEKASNSGLADRACLDNLEHELERAIPIEPERIPADVITMNSTARLRDLDTGELCEYTLVYPVDANADQQRISVLAPVGTALIGYRAGDVIQWPIPAGQVRLEVLEVTYQPERAGHFGR